ncbi:hypothetical protein VNO78_03548 [Psophocarpus tetragonolobus]|uniref:fructose-bisphosphatase n=1 Tax=Psophocarpus tetragonolobus TaxID=3891 RepID=A0AAN9T0Q9_PSOTE
MDHVVISPYLLNHILLARKFVCSAVNEIFFHFSQTLNLVKIVMLSLMFSLLASGVGKTHDALQPGSQMVVAGYCIYGSSCTFVLITRNGVNGFSLDPNLGWGSSY